MAEKDKKPTSSSDDLIPRSMLPDKPPPRPRTKAERMPLEKIEAMMGETKEGVKLPEKKMRNGGMPDLTGDGKITRADVLKGRGVFKKGGSVSSASKRADGIAQRGKTKGRIC
jgi:hypothetical protein